MQRGTEGKDDPAHSSGPFDSFGTRKKSMMSRIFGERNPLFFSSPFSSMFGARASSSGDSSPVVNSCKAPLIEEINTDDEEEAEGEDGDVSAGVKKEVAQMKNGVNSNPFIQHPEDQSDGRLTERKSTDGAHTSSNNRSGKMTPNAQSVSFQRVTYGGINGAYYTSTTSRRMGSEGMVIEESKEADRITGKATHRISRGIHDKGHSLTRKLESDGKVDTLQTLHNMNEDELDGFEQKWKGNADRNLPGFDNGFFFRGKTGDGDSGEGGSWPAWALSTRERIRGGSRAEGVGERSLAGGGRARNVVTINID